MGESRVGWFWLDQCLSSHPGPLQSELTSGTQAGQHPPCESTGDWLFSTESAGNPRCLWLRDVLWACESLHWVSTHWSCRKSLETVPFFFPPQKGFKATFSLVLRNIKLNSTSSYKENSHQPLRMPVFSFTKQGCGFYDRKCPFQANFYEVEAALSRFGEARGWGPGFNICFSSIVFSTQWMLTLCLPADCRRQSWQTPSAFLSSLLHNPSSYPSTYTFCFQSKPRA